MPVISSTNPDQMNPDFERIIVEAIKELDIKFPKYKNTWLNEPPGYFDIRLENEIDEFKKATGPEARNRKLLNIFNIAAMAIEADNGPGKCKVCGK